MAVYLYRVEATPVSLATDHLAEVQYAVFLVESKDGQLAVDLVRQILPQRWDIDCKQVYP